MNKPRHPDGTNDMPLGSVTPSIEDQIQAKGLTAPRITPADIEANIFAEHFFTAEHGVAGAFDRGRLWCTTHDTDTLNDKRSAPSLGLNLLTFCVLTLRNGFTVVGTSASCASPENFDAELGRKIARSDAVSKMWPLMGYALKSSLTQPS